jgi:hypothetical protein
LPRDRVSGLKDNFLSFNANLISLIMLVNQVLINRSFMPERKNVSEDMAEEIVQLVGKLQRKFKDLGINLSEEESLFRIPFDMATVYSTSTNYLNLIETLLALPNNSETEDVLRVIYEIESTFYLHMKYRQRKILKGMKRLAELIEPDENKREEFALKCFYEEIERSNQLSSKKHQRPKDPNLPD